LVDRRLSQSYEDAGNMFDERLAIKQRMGTIVLARRLKTFVGRFPERRPIVEKLGDYSPSLPILTSFLKLDYDQTPTSVCCELVHPTRAEIELPPERYQSAQTEIFGRKHFRKMYKSVLEVEFGQKRALRKNGGIIQKPQRSSSHYREMLLTTVRVRAAGAPFRSVRGSAPGTGDPHDFGTSVAPELVQSSAGG
jgi:hypothetical protein